VLDTHTAIRALTDWISTSGEFDGVTDSNSAVRDPANPDEMLPIYSSADTEQLNDAGHQAMANVIDLKLLDCKR
jgi:hypothetical protein